MKKALTIFLLMVLVLALMPMVAFAAGTTPTVCNALGDDFVTIAYNSSTTTMDIIIHKDRLTDAVKNTALAQKSGAGAYKGLAYEGVDFAPPAGATKVSVDGDTAQALVGGVFTEWYPVLYAVNPTTLQPIFPFDPINIITSADKTLAEQLGTTPYELITRIDAHRSLTGTMQLTWQNDSGDTILDETIHFNYKQVDGDKNTEVVANVNPTFTIVIPAKVDFGTLTKGVGTVEQPFTVSASGVLIDYNGQIIVGAASNPFAMKDQTNTVSLDFALRNSTAPVLPGGTYATFTANGSETGAVSVDTSDITYAGSYKGTMDFIISDTNL